MKRRCRRPNVFLIIALASACALELGSETLTLTIPYPPLAGIYNQIITTGKGLTNTILNRDAGNTLLLDGAKNPAGRAGIGTSAPNAKLDVNGVISPGSGFPNNAGAAISVGGAPADGSIYYNVSLHHWEYYNAGAGAWQNLGK